ncbi:MAG TPA: pyrroline-5-carboxylate reductase [Burkholderiaceae bacterium]|nr:pyrroline-5-carboxylate reductase [Burkholderiaceae bacterium]
MRVGFIGGGNMAEAMIAGLRRAAAGDEIVVVEPDDARRRMLAERFGAIVLDAPRPPLDRADVVVLAVKPQQAREACRQLGRLSLHADAVVLSIAAGIRARDLARWLPAARIVRSMPNTPALIGAGIAGLAARADVPAPQRDAAERVMRACGEVVWFDDERQLDAVTAVSGSGPAYVFHFIEGLQAAAERAGLAAPQARELALSTVVGAALLARQSAEPASVLRARVTSKGGTTAAALAVLDAAGVSATLGQAVLAAQRRAEELGDEFGSLD